MKQILILTLMLTLTIVGVTLSNSTRVSAYELTQAENMQDCKNCEGQTGLSACEDECILPCSGGALSVFAHMISSDDIAFIINDTVHHRERFEVLRGETTAPDLSPPKISL